MPASRRSVERSSSGKFLDASERYERIFPLFLVNIEAPDGIPAKEFFKAHQVGHVTFRRWLRLQPEKHEQCKAAIQAKRLRVIGKLHQDTGLTARSIENLAVASRKRRSATAERYLAVFDRLIAAMLNGHGVIDFLRKNELAGRQHNRFPTFQRFLVDHPDLKERYVAAVAAQRQIICTRPRLDPRLLALRKADVLDAIASGGFVSNLHSMNELLPSRATVLVWRHRDAAFDANYRSARSARIQALLADREEQAAQNRHRKATARSNRKAADSAIIEAPSLGPLHQLQGVLLRDAIYVAADKALSKKISAHRRDDILTDIVIAVLEGEIEFDRIGREADSYRRLYDRQFSEFEFNSLDATVGPDSDTSFLELLSTDDHWAD